MAVTRGGSGGSFSTSSAVTDVSYSTTVDASTTLLVLFISCEAGESVTDTPAFNTSENFTLIHATTESGSNADVRTYLYGLVSPTVTTANITFTLSATDTCFSCALNYIGTVSSSVANATNFLSEDVNNAAGETSTTVHASAGNSGNALLMGGAFKSGHGDPASNASSFTEIYDAATGTADFSDLSYYVAELLNSAPSAITVTWATTDSNVGNYIEIVAAAGAAANPKGPLGMPLHGPFGGPI